MIKLYNTLKRKKEIFRPNNQKRVNFYSCGPTVYWFAHLGNLRSYLFADILKRTLRSDGLKVNQIINITDVGHLTSDEDEGDDKIEMGAKRENKTARQIADFYAKVFKDDLKALNIIAPDKWTKATDYIKEQIELVKKLENKGYTYTTNDGVYFDTGKIKDYGKLSGSLKRTHRARIKKAKEKKRPTDFALWKFSTTKRQMEWDSPWGVGFPGWHTECVAMAINNFKVPFDIHTGGIDHIPVHHSNEIAQSQALFKNNLANYWLHNEFLTIDNKRASKSKGNIATVGKLIEKGYSPLAYRYLALTAHYRSKLSFSWQSISASQKSLDNLYDKVLEIKRKKTRGKNPDKYEKEFGRAIADDLDTPNALAVLWKLIKDNKIDSEKKYKLLLSFDKILGLNLDKIKERKIPQKIRELVKKRDQYRSEKNWVKSDAIRKEIEKMGYTVKDTKSETIVG